MLGEDGFLTLPEYALAMHLVQMKLDGEDRIRDLELVTKVLVHNFFLV